MRARFLIFLFSSFVLGAVPSQANDAIAELLPTGGLVLGETKDIEMRSEFLQVSTDEIRVHYRFYNKSNLDIKTRVAFPIPDLLPPTNSDGSYNEDREYGFQGEEDNFLNFSTFVNGKPVPVDIKYAAIVDGKDHIKVLRDLNIPLLHSFAYRVIDKLPKDKQNLLLTTALVREIYNGAIRENNLVPNWTLQSTFHWEQTFPAQKEITIEHRYKPVLGIRHFYTLTDDKKKLYCLDDAFLKAEREGEAKELDYNEIRVGYILKTGANWAGPIQDFHLVLDKGNPKSLVSFCLPNTKKISETQFELRAKNYVPTQNLDILILQPDK